MNQWKTKKHPPTPLKKRRLKISYRELNLNPRRVLQDISLKFEDICDETSSEEGSSWVSTSESKSSELEDDVFMPNKTTGAGAEDDAFSSPETMRRSGEAKYETWSLDPMFPSEVSSDGSAKVTGSKRIPKKKILHSTRNLSKRMGPTTPYLEKPINFSSINFHEISTSSKSEGEKSTESNPEQSPKSLKRNHRNNVFHSTGCEKMLPISPLPEDSLNLSPINISPSRKSNEAVSLNDAKRKSEQSENGLKRNHQNKILHSTRREKMSPNSPLFEESLNLSPININPSSESNEDVSPNGADRKSEQSKHGLKRSQENKIVHSAESDRTLPISPLIRQYFNFPIRSVSLSTESNEAVSTNEAKRKSKLFKNVKPKNKKTSRRLKTNAKTHLVTNENSKKKTAPRRKTQVDTRRQKTALDRQIIDVDESPNSPFFEESLNLSPININPSSESNEDVSPNDDSRKSEQSKNETHLATNENSKKKTALRRKMQVDKRKQKTTLNPQIMEVDEEEMRQYKEYLETLPICDLSLRKIFSKKK